MVDGKPILITKSQNRLSQCIAYMENKEIDIKDGKIKKILDTIKKE